MKWYWWVIIVIVVLIIFSYFVYKNKPDGKKLIIQGLNGNFGDILSDQIPQDSKDIVQELINKKYSFEQIKSEAFKRNILVLDSKETHTMEFNPKRVIIKRIQLECLVAPCGELILIESVG